MAARRPLRPEVVRRRRIVTLLFAMVVIAVSVVSARVVLGSGHGAPAVPAAPRPFRIVFPEGFTRAQMAERVTVVAAIARRERGQPVALNARSYLRASASAVVPCFGDHRYRDLEGFLFPATYDFVRTTSARTLVGDQIQAFCQRFAAVDLAYARSKNLTPYDVLIIASMVERETAVPSERRLVAAVIYNRLRAGMQLGIDATLRYGLNLSTTAPLTKAELASSNPYNTRRFYGLPPTPIANPGLASIEAAAHPAAVDYLYYAVIPGTNRQYFTSSAAAFDRFLSTHGYA